MGQSTCIGIGGDQIVGSGFTELLELFGNDDETKGIVLIGEIGGRDEEDAALYIKENISKPVVAFIAGKSAPKGKRMGHAGAIISAGEGTALQKANFMRAQGVLVAETPKEVAVLMRGALNNP